MAFHPQVIWLISNEEWGPIWFSKQHYANELVQLGYTVYFINPPGKWALKHLFSFQVSLSQTAEGIELVDYSNNFPVRIFPKLSTWLNDKLNQAKLSRICPQNNLLLWQFDPFRFVFTSSSWTRIYHVVDPYENLRFDRQIAQSSELIICTSPKALRYYKRLNSQVIHVPHCISEEEKQAQPKEVQEISQAYGKYVLLIGTLNKTIDFELLESLVQRNIQLVLAGKFIPQDDLIAASFEKLLSYSTCHFLGPVHAKKLKNYVSAAHVCITAYKFQKEKKDSRRSPLKILNYLAQYKPVITSIDPEIPQLEDKGIYFAPDKRSFLSLLERGLKDELRVDQIAVASYLKQHRYPDAIRLILNSIIDSTPKTPHVYG